MKCEIGVARRWVAAAMVFVAACGVRRGVETFGPDFTGARYLRMHGNVLPTPAGGIGVIELNGERVDRMAQASRAEQEGRERVRQRSPEVPPEFALLVEVRAEVLRVRQGASLELVMDGERYLLLRDSMVSDWPRLDPSVREQARYPAADSILRRLGSASEVRVGVHGTWWERRRVRGRSLEALQTFIREQVPGDTVAG